MKITQLLIGILLLVGLGINSAQAKKHGNDHYQRSIQNVQQTTAKDDSDLVRAVNDKRYVRFVEASQLVVSRLLPDDRKGLPHQRWYVRLSNGTEVFCVYNLNMGGKIPLKVGDKVAVGGEFKWTNIGPLMHWLHDDPQDRRPDGYVEYNGQRYGH